MEELDDNIVLYIDSIKIPQERNLQILKESDWSTKGKLEEREDLYKIHAFFVQRAVDNASKLYEIAAGDTRKKAVKNMLETLSEIFNIQSKRVESYISANDWSKDLAVSGTVSGSMLEEAEFQSKILQEINSARAKMQKLNIGDNIRSVNVPIFGDHPVPLIMRKAFEKKFPEIKEYLRLRMESNK